MVNLKFTSSDVNLCLLKSTPIKGCFWGLKSTPKN